MNFNHKVIDIGPVAHDASMALNNGDYKTEIDKLLKKFENDMNQIISSGTLDRSDESDANQLSDCYASSDVSSCDSESLTEFPASKEEHERVTSISPLEDMDNSDISYSPTSESIHGGQRAMVNTKNVIDANAASNSDEPLIKIETPDIKLSDLAKDSTVSRVIIPEINNTEVDNDNIAATFFNAVNNSDFTISNSVKPAPRSHSEHIVHSDLLIESTDITLTPNNDFISPAIINEASTIKGSTLKENPKKDESKYNTDNNDINNNNSNASGITQLEVNNGTPQEVIFPPSVVAQGKGFVIKSNPIINKRKTVQPEDTSSNALSNQDKKRRKVRFVDANDDAIVATAAAAIHKARNTATVASALQGDAAISDTLTSGTTPVTTVATAAVKLPITKQDSKELKLPTITFIGHAAKKDFTSHQVLISDAHGAELFVHSFESRLEALGLYVDLHWFTLLEICFEGEKSKNLPLYEWFKKTLNEGLSWSAAKSTILCTFGFFSENTKAAIKHELNFGFQSSDQDFESYFLWFCQVANAAVSIVKIDPSALNATDSGLAYVFINKLYFATKMMIPLLDLWGEDNRFNPAPSIPWKQFEDLVKQKMEYLMTREKVFKQEKIVAEKKEMKKRRMETQIFLTKRAEEEAEKLRMEKLRLEEIEKKRLEELEKKRLEELEMMRIEREVKEFEEYKRKLLEEIKKERLEEIKRKRLEEIEKQRQEQLMMEHERELKLQQKIERIRQKKILRKQVKKEKRRLQLIEEAKRQKIMLIADRKEQGICTFCGVAKHSFKHSRVCKVKKNIVQSWNQDENPNCCF